MALWVAEHLPGTDRAPDFGLWCHWRSSSQHRAKSLPSLSSFLGSRGAPWKYPASILGVGCSSVENWPWHHKNTTLTKAQHRLGEVICSMPRKGFLVRFPKESLQSIKGENSVNKKRWTGTSPKRLINDQQRYGKMWAHPANTNWSSNEVLPQKGQSFRGSSHSWRG